MRTSVGIDGGGSFTRMLWQHELSADEVACAEYLEKPISIKVVDRDFTRSAETLHSLLHEALHGDLTELEAIVIGLSGMSRPADQESLRQAIRAIPDLSNVRVRIETDAMMTLQAGLKDEEEGILLIAGTGSVVFVRTSDGLHRLGGWGPLLSDEGSGYWIGLRALQYFVLANDERAERDELFTAIEQLLPQELRDSPMLLSQHLERHPRYPSRFAKAVFETMSESRVSEGIIEGAAGCLSSLIKRGLDLLDDDTTYPVVLSGSIAKHSKVLEFLTHMLYESGAELRLLDAKAPVKKALQLATAM